MTPPILELSDVSKAYGGLRPLRVRALTLGAGGVLGLAGFDQQTAEVFVNLVTGATLPEEGTVTVFGRATSAIADSAEWLAMVDRFGIVSDRVVLLEQFTPLQNIAMSLTLDVEPVAPDVAAEAASLGREVGLTEETLSQPVADSGIAVRHRVRLARALATSPAVLLIEHPVSGLEPREIDALAADLARAAAARQLAVVVLGADPLTVAPFAPRVLVLNGGTGELLEKKARGVFAWLARKGTGGPG